MKATHHMRFRSCRCGSRAACGPRSRSTLASRANARSDRVIRTSRRRQGGMTVNNPKILVLGAGGTGGYFGGRLAESGADVTFLVREGRRKILSGQGLRIESPYGDARIAPKTVVESELAPIYDAVILTCKAYDLDTAAAAISPAVGPTGY